MALLTNSMRAVDLASIGQIIPDTPATVYLDELKTQHTATLSKIALQIDAIKQIHLTRTLDMATVTKIRTLFPMHVQFLNTLPVTVTPTLSGVTDLLTYMHPVITDAIIVEVTNLLSDYGDVLPTPSIGEEVTPTVAKLLKALSMVNNNVVRVGNSINTSKLQQIASVCPKSMSIVGMEPAVAVNKLTNTDMQREITLAFKLAKHYAMVAKVDTWGSMNGLEQRFNVAKDVLNKVQLAYVIPMWKAELF